MFESLGSLLGCGRQRVCFELRDDPTIAVKIAHRLCGPEENRLEWEIWNKAPNKIKKWLAPCLWISDDGFTLHMMRGEPGQRPERYPEFLTDAKDANWVKIGDSVVLCDYARESIAEQVRVKIRHGIPRDRKDHQD